MATGRVALPDDWEEVIVITFITSRNSINELQSTTRLTEFFVVGIFSVILVKFAILVGTKSLGETAHCM